MHFNFNQGFHVFSGETGSGKSLLLNAIRFVLGQRIHPSPIGPFGDCTSVSMTLTLHNQDLKIHREIFSHGKGTLTCNGKRILIKELEALIKDAFTLVHQEDEPQYHSCEIQSFLDQYADISHHTYNQKYDEYTKLKKSLKKFKLHHQSQDAIDLKLSHLPELKQFNPSMDDYEAIELRLKHQDKQADNKKTLESLQSTFQSTTFRKHLNDLQMNFNQMDHNEWHHQFTDAYENLLDLKESVDQSCNDLKQSEHPKHLEARLSAYHIYIRRYGSLNQVITMYHDLMILEAQNLNFEEELSHLQEAILRVEREVHDLAAQISILRVNAIQPFTKAVNQYLEMMLLPEVSFTLSHTTGKIHNKGYDHFELHVSMNQEDQLNLFSKTASGGEKARVHLAIMMACAQSKHDMIYIFDEIDTGVSGKVANAMGQCLKSLSGASQVFAITHQAPVASYADQHYNIFKERHKDGIMSQAKPLYTKGRQLELAMMMSGHHSEESMQLAQQLLDKGGT